MGAARRECRENVQETDHAGTRDGLDLLVTLRGAAVDDSASTVWEDEAPPRAVSAGLLALVHGRCVRSTCVATEGPLRDMAKQVLSRFRPEELAFGDHGDQSGRPGRKCGGEHDQVPVA